MQILSELLSQFDITGQAGCLHSDKWHLSFIRPCRWSNPEKIDFFKETTEVSVDGKSYNVYIEYAVLNIDRPWFKECIFDMGFKHKAFEIGKISNGQGEGFLPLVNTGIIVTRKIKIDNIYENNSYQIIGWIVKNIKYCPN